MKRGGKKELKRQKQVRKKEDDNKKVVIIYEGNQDRIKTEPPEFPAAISSLRSLCL
jgi:hypothetical protein